jgi:hypothetical protein
MWAMQLLTNSKIEAKSTKVYKTVILLEVFLSPDPKIT